MNYHFELDERLGIELPVLHRDWDHYSKEDQSTILLRWENIRGTIPDHIKRLERAIIAKQNQLDVEDNFAASCALTWDIAELASTINELHIWFRVNQDFSEHAAHH
jgi:hypothetical protein